MRAAPDEEPEHVLVLTTLDAPRSRRPRRRRAIPLREAQVEAVAISRATVVTSRPFADRAAAGRWLDDVRTQREPAEVGAAIAVLNRALHAHRAARADPYARDVSVDRALAVRIGFGAGEAVADGRYDQAWELARERRSQPRRSMEGPEERFAVLLSARETVLACEELVLRARADVAAGRPREAALQSRVALESLLAEIGDALPPERRAALEADRDPIGEAANAALRNVPPLRLEEAVRGAIGRMEAALRARRLARASPRRTGRA